MSNSEKLVRVWAEKKRREMRLQRIAIVLASIALFAIAAGIWTHIWLHA